MGHNKKAPHQARAVSSWAAIFSSAHAVISDRAVLRAAVCVYLAAEQARGATVASVVQAVGDILAKAAQGAAHPGRELAQQLVDSCLEPYGAPGLA